MTEKLVLKRLGLAAQLHHKLTTLSSLLGGVTEDDFNDLETAFIKWGMAQPQSWLACADHCLKLVRAGKPLPFEIREPPSMMAILEVKDGVLYETEEPFRVRHHPTLGHPDADDLTIQACFDALTEILGRPPSDGTYICDGKTMTKTETTLAHEPPPEWKPDQS